MAQRLQGAGRSRTCLIIEDNEVDQIKMTRVVQRPPYGMRAHVASTLRAARRALAGDRPGLILLDNNLPDGLGANFAQELAGNPALAGVPMIIVSDWPSPFMWEKAASAGVAYVLSKAEFDGRYVHAALDGRTDNSLSGARHLN